MSHSQFPYVGMPVIFWPKAVDKIERDEIWPLSATIVGLNSESAVPTDECEEHQKVLSVNIAGYDRLGKPFDRQEVPFASGDDGDLEDGFCQANGEVPRVAAAQGPGGGSKFTMRDVENNLKTLYANYRDLSSASDNQTKMIAELKSLIDSLAAPALSTTEANCSTETDGGTCETAPIERDDI